MSGGPVFAIRRSRDTGIITYEFLGIVYEFSEDFELLYIGLARVLGLDDLRGSTPPPGNFADYFGWARK